MPEPVSLTVGVCLTYAALQGFSRGGSAVSREAQAVRDAVCAVVERTETSQALFGGKAAAISQLRALVNECSQSGWDGAEACALNALAMFQAENFIRVLPDYLPLPEFAPEPDGSISLDWIQSKHRLFSLSIGASNRLAYAWLDGTDKGHAVARFSGDKIPQRIIEGITEIMTHGYTSLRAA